VLFDEFVGVGDSVNMSVVVVVVDFGSGVIMVVGVEVVVVAEIVVELGVVIEGVVVVAAEVVVELDVVIEGVVVGSEVFAEFLFVVFRLVF
jgi:hypothetical protein